ncbi:hypothetical protein D9756_009788 [Leucocoprinus leucothites]|uniref:pyranose dehydrogenase (acceptor) n=1 Tax=Leucocoprinus leucothites TaxID=201217 RepID=A0A8H5CVH4_9AGAR|nr:hypothetical protein D9756_009788 [Leucoagaricus leucothites]
MPIATLDEFLARSNSPDSPFDYLIIGGGTAGLVVAHRLTENANISVGVIEAGLYHGRSDEKPILHTPGLIGLAVNNPLYDWILRSVPQANGNNRILPFPRGKCLGGSSLINYLGHTRPSKDEYDALEASFNNTGWTWDTLLEYMKKSESFSQYEVIESRGRAAPPGSYVPKPDAAVHGTHGPILHSQPPPWPPYDPKEAENEGSNLNRVFLQAMDQLGVPANPEPCGGYNIGCAKPLMTIDPKSSLRSSSVSGYLEPIVDSRPNLLVLTGATVTRVLFENTDNSGKPKAVGVELYTSNHNARTQIRNIRREVILSTGTFKTPQILECSGLGNPAILNPLGVECIVDLPGVGGNLQDHSAVSFIGEVDPRYVTADILLEPDGLNKHQKLFDERKDGLLADTSSQALCYLSLDHVTKVTGTPHNTIVNQLEQQSREYINKLNPSPAVQRGYEKQRQLLTKWLSERTQAQIEIINFSGHLPINGLSPDITSRKRYFTLTACLVHPFSRGTVQHVPTPLSSSTESQPRIDPNVLSHPLDATLLLQGMEFILHLTETEPYKSAIKSWIFPSELSSIDLKEALKPNADHSLKAQVNDILEAHLRSSVRTTYHPVGTAAMMSKEDGGVVDDRLRVYGVDGLRVADLSVLPYIISAHTVSAAFAVGERAAELVLEDYAASS